MTDKPTIFRGRIWLITDEKGFLADDIDTDMIFHNAHLAITDINEMGQHTFGNMKGWEHFPEDVKEGDIVLAGRNFGSGSSRQQAVDCFAALGVKALACESYGAIYKRNAINSGFPVVIFPGLVEKIKKSGGVKHLQDVELDILTGKLKNAATGEVLVEGLPLSEVQIDIYEKGGLLKYNPEKK